MDENSSGDYDSKISDTIEDENSSYEGSSVSERCDSSVENEAEAESDEDNINEKLHERIDSLKQSMTFLQGQLKEEKEMWKREVEEAMRVTVQPYSRSQSTIDSETESEVKASECETFSICEYEQKLLKYQEALQLAQQDKRASLQRQIAISNYKRRLLEVENMCNLELLKVKQSVQFLQPLQMMLSEWNTATASNPPSDFSPPAPVENKIISQASKEEAKVNEIIMPLEIIGNRLQSDMNEMITKISAKTCNSSMPQLTTTSAMWQAEDNFMAHSQSTVWYAECQTKFNL